MLVDPIAADDLAAEAFEKVIGLIRDGKGPDLVFRTYLVRTIRTGHIDQLRRVRLQQRHESVDPDPSGVDASDPFVDVFEKSAITDAYRALPEAWRLVLWHIEVDGADRHEVAELLGVTPEAVSSMLYRARRGLRTAYLQAHVGAAAKAACQWTVQHLGGYASGFLAAAKRRKVDEHLRGCLSCTAAAAELRRIETSLGAVVAVCVLGAFGKQYAGTALPKVGVSWPWWHGVSAFMVPVVIGIALIIHGLGGVGDPAGSGSGALPTTQTTVHSSTTGPGSIGFAGGPAPGAATTDGTASAPPLDGPPTDGTEPPWADPTPSVTAITGSAAPSATADPTEPTFTPTTTSTPSATPPVNTTVDAALGARVRSFTRGESVVPTHVTIPVSVDQLGVRLQLTLIGSGLRKFSAHDESSFGRWNCRRDRAVADHLQIGCVLDVLSADQPLDLGIDLGFEDVSDALIEVTIEIANNVDPMPSNNRLVTSIA